MNMMHTDNIAEYYIFFQTLTHLSLSILMIAPPKPSSFILCFMLEYYKEDGNDRIGNHYLTGILRTEDSS